MSGQESYLKDFEATNQRLGVSSQDLDHLGGPLVLSSDPSESMVKAHLLPIQSIAHFDNVVGSNEAPHVFDVDALKSRLQPLVEIHKNQSNQGLLKASLTKNDMAHLHCATQAIVNGHAQLLDQYESLINATLFPMKLSVFSIPKVTVSSQNPLVITGDQPVYVNHGLVNMEPGAEINVSNSNSFININKLDLSADTNALAASDSHQRTINVQGKPFNSPAPSGRDGGMGAPGQPGSNGTDGANGHVGNPGVTATLSFDELSSDVTIIAHGGTGQVGGKGGNGGQGGSNGGRGGSGGNGGNGGDGSAIGSTVFIYYQVLESPPVERASYSSPGAGGQGGNHGYGQPNGQNGHHGEYGKYGANSTITLLPASSN